ncbi:hypothetical protein [Herbiconiux sp. VKM Ac-2851]|uniref:hypothetical protein n=1 Tax=Herbiconiux sp. VKM Ac-2851 TaxID=2739025 RepID=UPI001565E647|nr:hypothetical protein [Herbiconiux sp. VKM Ac-2851]NQX34711.1 hypothetical protein [Herbiconiux sp. VKM Ac-2851]
MSVELLAVNAVTDRIVACPRLSPQILVGDRTPITDGHIDFYSSGGHSNKTLEGRVPVQVKGRVTKANVKTSRDGQSFGVEREVLRFFRNHGGGVYFYVPMREGGINREIFYSILLPFKIDRLLQGSPASQKTFSIKLTRLPRKASDIEAIVQLAWSGRSQSSVSGKGDHVLGQAESLTITSLVGFNETTPTRLVLSETDYVVMAHLADGIEIAVDIDLEILPFTYMEREIAVPIACGDVEFDRVQGRQIDANTILLRLSEGLQIRLNTDNGKVSTTLSLEATGTWRKQAKNFDFMLASAAGNPLVIDGVPGQPHDGDPGVADRAKEARAELGQFSELFDELGIDDDLTSAIMIDDDMRRMLLALHQGIVQDRPVRGTADGTGRYDVTIGDFRVMVMILPAEDDRDRTIVDPFDPAKRGLYRIYEISDDGTHEAVELATVYEAVSPEDMALILNLRLRHVVDAYASLENRTAATSRANMTLLRLLLAVDLVSGESHRAYLLRGATDLCTWLLDEDPDSLIHRINWWQIQYREGTLTDEDRRDIRAARRSLNVKDPQAGLLEACLLILVSDREELELVLTELNTTDLANLKTWPVWTLSPLEWAR